MPNFRSLISSWHFCRLHYRIKNESLISVTGLTRQPLAARHQMKFGLTIMIFGFIFPAFGQNKIFYEQIGFEFYRDSILKANPPKKKLTLWTELEKFETNPYW